MTENHTRVGVHLRRPTVAESLVFARKADAAGIDTGWLTLGGQAFNSLSFIAVAAPRRNGSGSGRRSSRPSSSTR